MMQDGGLNRARRTRPAFGRSLILASLESRTGWYGRLEHVMILFEPACAEGQRDSEHSPVGLFDRTHFLVLQDQAHHREDRRKTYRPQYETCQPATDPLIVPFRLGGLGLASSEAPSAKFGN